MYKAFIKRGVDILFSFIGTILLSPILLILTIILLFANNGKPFFLQKRPGKHGKLFKIIKFKTMRDLKEGSKNDEHNLNRITKVGAFVRKYSLDEVLQLINVLKGDMSLVGPRPLLEEYLPLYNKTQKKRHLVKPGITGWAQIKGRNTISWNEKFNYDVWYVEHLSLRLDLKILMLTVLKVIKKDGVNSSTHITMPAWKGNK